MFGYILLFLFIVALPDNPQVPKQLRQIEPDIPDISGYYNCKGKEASGKGYTGVVILSRKGDVYMVQWVLQGGTSIVGVGIRQGASFSAAWALPKDGGITVRGVNVYRVEGTASGPRLVGRWASIPGDGQQQVEVLTFLKKLDPEE